MLNSVTSTITSVPPLAAYTIIFALVFGEAALFVGFVLPGETAVLLGGFLASSNHLDIVTLCVLVVIAAVLGDSVGYEVGKHFGPRLLRLKFFRKHQERLDTASALIQRRGGPAIFLGRFTAFARAVMPGLAGLSQMRYRTFLAWNALGGLIWGIGFCLIGYFAGQSYEKVAGDIGTGAAIVFVLVVIGGLVFWHLRRRRSERDEATRLPGAQH